jgi:ubiquinone/menaquinone biosynthesis C-methylase UbiE
MQPEYILGTHDAELDRLGLQHRLWSEAALALWERAFKPGQTILDAGCGPGFATLDLARFLGPTSRVVALDESPRFIDYLRKQAQAHAVGNVEVLSGDVQNLADAGIAAASLDGAYCRWVLCWVRDPAAVVAGVARALKPGGIFAVQDYFNYLSLTLAPRSAAFSRAVAAVKASYDKCGGDPDIVGRLPRMLSEVGMEVLDIRSHVRVARPGSPLWQWPDTFFRNYVPRMAQMGLLTAREQAEFLEDWERRSADPDTFFFTPPVFDVVARKRG